MLALMAMVVELVLVFVFCTLSKRLHSRYKPHSRLHEECNFVDEPLHSNGRKGLSQILEPKIK